MVAPRIIWRYILRDVFLHSLLGLAVMSLLLVVQNLLRFAEDLVAVGVGLDGLLQLVLVILPSYLAYAIPTALLFGILLSFGRMSADGEIVAFRASGISVPRMLPPVLVLGAFATLITGHLLWNVEPASRLHLKTLFRDFAKTVKVIQPGRFRVLGEHVVYVHENGDEACPLRGVLISDFQDPKRQLYISAKCAAIVESEEDSGTPSLSFVLSDGSIHFSDVDESRYRKIRFAQMETSFDLTGYLHGDRHPDDHSFAELLVLNRRFQADQDLEVAGIADHSAVLSQIHRRVAFPMAPLLLAIVAVPLGIRPLRSGRSAGALTAIGVMALYWVLFATGEMVAERGFAPPWLAVWTPNAIVLALGVWMIRRTVHGDT